LAIGIRCVDNALHKMSSMIADIKYMFSNENTCQYIIMHIQFNTNKLELLCICFMEKKRNNIYLWI